MKNEQKGTSQLDQKRKISASGGEYWLAREIQPLLEYADWENFLNVIKKATASCEKAGLNPKNHFRDITEEIGSGKGATGKRKNFFLSRYACYLIAMNGDPSKEAIAYAQAYFAVQTRRQEIADQFSEDHQRIELREKLRQATKDLNSSAKKSGVQNYGLFHDAGYRGLYGMGLSLVKSKKGLSKNDDLFDRAGRSELAANFFRATQAAERLERQKINGEDAAKKTHHEVGSEVRSTIQKLGNTTPENLPAEPDIKSVKKKIEAAKNPKLNPPVLSPDDQG
jgi:DNA-damage-inducible protein D